VFDVSDPTIPTEVGLVGGLGTAIGVTVCNSYAFVSDAHSRLYVIDISDPHAPLVVGSVATSDIAYDVAVSGIYAYVAVADYDVGLEVFDVSDPTAPVLVGSADTGSGAWSVVVSDGLVIAGGDIFRDCWVFGDGFESGDTSAWPLIVP
jgi:hypothetical protein